MAPTVGWLLTRPELGLRLVAGDAGAEREIRWVHATELENPGPWMSGGELVLTIGLRLPRNWDGIAKSLRPARYALRLARARRAELVEFADLGVVDLLFGVQEIAALADRHLPTRYRSTEP